MAKKVSEAQLHITGKDKTKTAFKSVQGRLKRMKDSLMGVKGAMGLLGVASIGVFVKMAKDAANTADEIRKMSGRIGITTDALQEMRFAFGLAGVEGDVLTKGLLNFSKSLGEARVGTGALTTFLKKSDEALLGQLVSARNTTQALNIFLNALSKTTNQADKMALSSAALGRAGKLMTTAFENGADAFAKAREEAHRLGLVIDRELLENAEAMNDQLSIVSDVIKIHLTKAFLELAPEITKSAKALTEFIVALKNLGEGNLILTSNSNLSIWERTVRSIGFALDIVGMKLANLLRLPGLEKIFEPRAMEQFLKLQEGMKPSIPDTKMGFEKTAPSLPAVEPLFGVDPFDFDPKLKILTVWEALEAQKKKIKSIPFLDPHDLDLWTIQEDKLSADFEKMFEDSKKTSFMQKAIFEQKLEQIAITEKQADLERKIFKGWERQENILKKKLDMDKLGVQLLEERHELEGKIGRVLEPDEVDKLKLKINYFNKLNEQLQFQNELAGIGERVFERMGDGLINALQRGEDAFDSLKNVALAALFDIGQEMLRIAVIQPLKEAGGSFLASIGKAIGGSLFGGSGGGGGNTFDAFGDMLAHGGTASGGKAHLVGEQGPELFVPNTTGTVIPNNQLGGGVTNVTLNITTGIQGTVRAEIMGLMPQITEQVKHAVAEARQRGGAFSAAMGT